jgi:hypothetical protein
VDNDDDDGDDGDGDNLVAVSIVLLLPRHVFLLVEIPAAFGCSHVFQHTDSILATTLYCWKLPFPLNCIP